MTICKYQYSNAGWNGPKIFIDKTFLLMIWSHNSMALFLAFPFISRVQDEFTKEKMARHTHVYTHTAHYTLF